MRVLIAVLLLLAVGCHRGELRPAALDKDDVCFGCKMAISEPRFAAQVVDKDGNQYKFDDVACMLNFTRTRNLQRPGAAAFFVMDYASARDWLVANRAAFVRSGKLATPMASGLAAFRDVNTARQFASENGGVVLTFDELLTTAAKPEHVLLSPCCRRG